jgi:hypothetical protein
MNPKSILAGALILNVPTAAAAVYLPPLTVAVMAVSLAVLGAALGNLAAWTLCEPAAVAAEPAADGQPDLAQAA